MKTWENAEIVEMNVADTQYGGTTVTDFDNIYQNADGNWEGTFNPS